MIHDYIQRTTTAIEAHLDSLLPEQPLPYQQLFQAARYATLNGGKRLRPLLLLTVVDSLGKPIDQALSSACAVEMIHTYSLIHDDLPCMDNDDFRRGKPSLHKAFPEAHALLAGDFLLTYAFEVIADDAKLAPATRVELLSMLTKRCGAHGLIGGQVMDIDAEGKTLPRSAIEAIHRYKTGALITSAVVMGGIVAGASKDTLHTLELFGNEIGLAFQIADDLLDVSGNTHKRGSPGSSDLAKDKMTYVKLLGIEGAQQEAEGLMASAKNRLGQLPMATPLLADLTDIILQRQH